MDALTFKLLAAVAVLATGLLGGLLPLRLARVKASALVLALGNALAGGVFLGAALIHMLPDAATNFATAFNNPDYPWFGLVTVAGFLVILAIDKALVGVEAEDGALGTETHGALFAYVLLLVLAVHSVITGIALGAETALASAMVILIAILAHKGTAAFALGVALIEGGVAPGRLVRLVALFACTTPLGILAGSVLTVVLTGAAARVFEAVFDALAAGTFLYVATLEILGREFARGEARWAKLLLVVVGVAIMAVVAIWT